VVGLGNGNIARTSIRREIHRLYIRATYRERDLDHWGYRILRLPNYAAEKLNLRYEISKSRNKPWEKEFLMHLRGLPCATAVRGERDHCKHIAEVRSVAALAPTTHPVKRLQERLRNLNHVCGPETKEVESIYRLV
jgi:hypothetical protein